MQFRFRISPDFSITGQVIAQLIKAELPQDQAQRIELFTAILDKFESVWKTHEAARKAAVASQEGGPGFVLYLRNFGIEEVQAPDPGIERMYDMRAAEFEKSIAAQSAAAGLTMVSLRGGNDALDEFLGFANPFFTGRLENWKSIAEELIAAAKAIRECQQ